MALGVLPGGVAGGLGDRLAAGVAPQDVPDGVLIDGLLSGGHVLAVVGSVLSIAWIAIRIFDRGRAPGWGQTLLVVFAPQTFAIGLVCCVACVVLWINGVGVCPFDEARSAMRYGSTFVLFWSFCGLAKLSAAHLRQRPLPRGVLVGTLTMAMLAAAIGVAQLKHFVDKAWLGRSDPSGLLLHPLLVFFGAAITVGGSILAWWPIVRGRDWNTAESGEQAEVPA